MILILDDDEAMAETCSMFLESQGFEVSIASCSAQALSMIREHPPQLLISDCVMPGMTGTELSDELRSNVATSQMPILLMSGSLRGDVAKNGGFDGFLRKPFLAEDLLLQVRKLLANISTSPIHPVEA